jgi:hypothetical protein
LREQLSILTVILRWLWNSTLPALFELQTVTFCQAFRLLLIATIPIRRPAVDHSSDPVIDPSVIENAA